MPVPRAYCLCEDASVVGTPFYIMSFLDGRIIEGPAMPDASPEERAALWRAAVETLARFHRVEHRKMGLESYGRGGDFYDRQLATWKTICDAQAGAVDAETQQPVGAMPHFEGFLEFFSDRTKQPTDRSGLVHGDYKIDNIVFHKTKPVVIGILDWEMSTVGHPLSDLSNLMNPFYSVHMKGDVKHSSSDAFLPGNTPGLPTPEMVMKWYADTAGWDPRPDINWGMAFSLFRLSAICQGIAARVATRQASSEQAKKHAESLGPLAEFAWELVGKVKDQVRSAAKL